MSLREWQRKVAQPWKDLAFAKTEWPAEREAPGRSQASALLTVGPAQGAGSQITLTVTVAQVLKTNGHFPSPTACRADGCSAGEIVTAVTANSRLGH